MGAHHQRSGKVDSKSFGIWLSTATHSQRDITVKEFPAQSAGSITRYFTRRKQIPLSDQRHTANPNTSRLSTSGRHLSTRASKLRGQALKTGTWAFLGHVPVSIRDLRVHPTQLPNTYTSLAMGSSSLRAALLALVLASTSSATTVSLASFIPRIDNLPKSCNAVYTSSISGCVADDFKSGATCSAACVRGLSAIAESVKDKCANVDAGELSIIGVFQNGLGIQSLCPGVTITTISSESAGKTDTKTLEQATSTQAVLTTTSFTNSAIQATSTSSSSNTDAEDGDEEPTSSAQTTSSSSSTGGLVLDPNATGTFTASVIPPTDTAQATQAPNAQLSNADSGGGSPFDVVAVGASSQLRTLEISIASLCGLAVALLASS